MSCVFCDIVRGEAPASFVHQDEDVVAFLDIRPFTTGHLLVVPRAHAVGLGDLDEDLGAKLWRIAQRLGGALRRSGLRCDGVNLFLADGAAAFQEVFHFHLHVIPRFRGDRVRLRAKPRTPDRGELDQVAAAVRDAGL
ncbi:HIT family protein [Amycolatopsis sp. K13G38]|uniref:HIT family protein n=1 Tax=Amycolatopsis acididurans TaxID=2724524 RepID=A0ABX1JCA8_9PSEU|nr:HIT family protein [Amycolatopsis acididurans]NKQ55912.1 HIT family protein [Amycolatopsis acididurans]